MFGICFSMVFVFLLSIVPNNLLCMGFSVERSETPEPQGLLQNGSMALSQGEALKLGFPDDVILFGADNPFKHCININEMPFCCKSDSYESVGLGGPTAVISRSILYTCEWVLTVGDINTNLNMMVEVYINVKLCKRSGLAGNNDLKCFCKYSVKKFQNKVLTGESGVFPFEITPVGIAFSSLLEWIGLHVDALG